MEPLTEDEIYKRTFNDDMEIFMPYYRARLLEMRQRDDSGEEV